MDVGTTAVASIEPSLYFYTDWFSSTIMNAVKQVLKYQTMAQRQI